ncbi:Nramp family divalent metal transporter [Budvicia aquatica]|uniref:Manganese transport protein MntH n=1 Tax=Budvicia aquatica TaxID=82979 RepID=A0A484ZXS0_9GAMM|nr:Nramp family divalent metal transporter [Budvicia aquatica]VFS52771.1 Manganese transport protein MntH [Budvicia aquatica]
MSDSGTVVPPEIQPTAESNRASRKMRLSLMGPAFIAAIGYIDPGNFATNIQAGSTFGYQLLWVVVWANIMAMVVQLFSAKLGIATNKNLAEHIRDRFPRPVVWFLLGSGRAYCYSD